MKLKICGVQSVEEAERLAGMGVEFVSLNFVLDAMRRIDLATGRAIATALKDSSTKVVLLFKNQPLDVVTDYAERVQPDYVQLHGDETNEYISALPVPVIKALTPRQFEERQAVPPATYYLLDRNERGQGPVVDPDIAAKVVSAYPQQVFLAGGLTPKNLPAILKKVQPFAIDIAGGVRTDDRLDFDKVSQVLEIVRSQRP